jgi:2-keto-4-pentenoate hydratase/2-oxohepta-3-ene-1,7-dioic acid hydratase in catechol pathway
MPSKIIAIGANYTSHIEELKRKNRPPQIYERKPNVPPPFFLKPPSAVIGPDDKIVLPSLSGFVDYEGELGVVIGSRAKNIKQDTAENYVLGYTCFNDVAERNYQREDSLPTRAKGFDTFAPTGPWIETDIDPKNLKIETYLNGEIRQSAPTSELISGVTELISLISAVMTLIPGDIIATGTPAGTGMSGMQPGDVVEVKIDKIGTLRNFVVGPE